MSKSGTSGNGDHREKDELVLICTEEGRGARARKNCICTGTKPETKRKTENQVERLECNI